MIYEHFDILVRKRERLLGCVYFSSFFKVLMLRPFSTKVIMVLHRVHQFGGCLLEYLQSVFFDLSTLNNMWCYPPLMYSHSNWRLQNSFACPTSLTRFGPTLIWFSGTSLMVLQTGTVSPGRKFKRIIIRFERGFHDQNANALTFRPHEFVNACTISSFIICELPCLLRDWIGFPFPTVWNSKNFS